MTRTTPSRTWRCSSRAKTALRSAVFALDEHLQVRLGVVLVMTEALAVGAVDHGELAADVGPFVAHVVVGAKAVAQAGHACGHHVGINGRDLPAVVGRGGRT